MATLDTTDVIAVKFQADTVQTKSSKTFTHSLGDIIAIKTDEDSITVDVTTDVACMLTTSEAMRDLSNIASVALQGFCVDEIRTPA